MFVLIVVMDIVFLLIVEVINLIGVLSVGLKNNQFKGLCGLNNVGAYLTAEKKFLDLVMERLFFVKKKVVS
jgi:hypothetical protein